MTAPRDMSSYYDITEGDWRVIASPAETTGEAVITFAHKGVLFRQISYPAYKVWNISAHLSDIIADFEQGMALAGATFGSEVQS